jgi:hypothetical protein
MIVRWADSMDVEEIKTQLLRAIEARDAEALEAAVTAAWHASLPVELAEGMAVALLMPWHKRHEDLAGALQRIRDPQTVDALFETASARHAYLAYDEFFGLARKCTWALADIGTPKAKAHLLKLAHESNTTIAGYAQKRLDHWDEERHRKRP